MTEPNNKSVVTPENYAENLAAVLWVQEPHRNLDRALVLEILANWVDKYPMTIDQLEETAQILKERR